MQFSGPTKFYVARHIKFLSPVNRQSGQKVLATFAIVLGKTHIVASTNMSDLAL